MSQRFVQRAAQQAFSLLRDAGRCSSAANTAGGAASLLRTAAARSAVQSSSGIGALAQCPAFRSFQQQGLRLGAQPSAIPMSFAASAATSSPAASCSPLGSVAGDGSCQVRGMASGSLTEDGEGEDSTASHGRLEAEPPDRIAGGQDELQDFLRDLRPPEQMAKPAGGFVSRFYEQQDRADPFELIALAKETFMGKDHRAVDIPMATREVLYQHRWDKFLVDCRRTVEMTKRGKQEAYTAMVITGNMKGLAGLGIGVAPTAQLSVAKAYLDSCRNLSQVALYRGHTLYHHVDHDFHRMKMRLMPRPDGFGLQCSDLLYELCSVVGLRNASIKLFGRRQSKFFVAQCFMEALRKQSTPHDGVEASGMYIREVARAGRAGRLPFGLKATL